MSPITWKALCLGPFQTNTYLLVAESHTANGDDRDAERPALVIDPSFEPEPILAAIREMRLRVEAIVLTHGHVDHVSAVGPVHEETGADIVIHREDLALYQRAPRSAVRFGLQLPPLPEVSGFLSEESPVMCGAVKARVIHTPGHTPGGVCLHFSEAQLLVAGDTLFHRSIGRTDLPGGSFPQIEKSIRTKLYPLDDATEVLPGHGPPTTIGQEKQQNPFVSP